MGVQLLAEALPVAIGVLAYSLFCMLCSLLMICLAWKHHERDSYIAFLSYFTLLSTCASIAQQIHTIIWWRDIKIDEWKNSAAHIKSAELTIASTSVGIDLALFYVQYYSYNVEALLTLCWAVSLTRSVFGFVNDKSPHRMLRRQIKLAIKIVAAALPALFIGLLQSEAVKHSLVGFLVLANINMMVSLTFGGLLLICVLGKYIHTRRQFISWNVQYGHSISSQGTGAQNSMNLALSNGGPNQSRNIYDRWLLVRFTIGFIVLGIFEFTTILFEVLAIHKNGPDAAKGGPELTAAQATSDFIWFMPGVTASILVFIVFGTTRPFRETIWRAIIPKRFLRDSKHLPTSMQPNSRRSRAPKWPAPHPYAKFGDMCLSPFSPLSPLTPDFRAHNGASIMMQEMHIHHSAKRDDEWPTVPPATTTRVNDK